MHERVTVAAAHLAPAYLDKAKTAAKAVDAISEAASEGAQMVAFPEAFLPGFPLWTALRAPIYNHSLFARYVDASVYVDGPEIASVRAAARRHGIVVSLGFSERSRASVGGLWNSNVLIGSDGSMLNHHRKLVPTFYEKLIWTPGDGHGLVVRETEVGRLGMLICGENTNPLARYSLMAQAEEVHVSSWPPLWPTRDSPPGGRSYNLENAIRIRAGAHSFEAKAFSVVVSSVWDESASSVMAELGADSAEIIDGTARGVSMIISPFGEVITRVLQDDEEILLTEIDLGDCVEPKQFHDVTGNYNRFDVFELSVNRRRIAPIRFEDGADSRSLPTDRVDEHATPDQADQADQASSREPWGPG